MQVIHRSTRDEEIRSILKFILNAEEYFESNRDRLSYPQYLGGPKFFLGALSQGLNYKITIIITLPAATEDQKHFWVKAKIGLR